MASVTLSSWQQAVDTRLVRRLWQRAERPGLSRPRQSQDLLARHQSIVASTPLAEHLQRHVDAAAQAFPGQLPIVYMQPQETAAASNTNGSQPVVIQRAAAPGTAAATPPAPALMPMEHSVLLSPLTLPAFDEGYTPRTDVTRSTPGSQLPSGQTAAPAGLPVVSATRATDLVSVLKQLPLVRSLPVSGGADSTSASTAQSTSSAVPIGRSALSDWGSSADRLIARWSPPPTPNAIDASGMPVVHEQVIRDRAVQANLSIAAVPLPLAAVAAPAPQPVTGQFVSSERQSPALRHKGIHPSQGNAAEPAVDPVAAKQPAQNEIDIDQIVNKVHRKFIQQLAVEGERRGRR